ncbi:expressed unknown protein [Seminavis robusta]|uniref:Uncharacterized protein n=1 Tax=Seminavis robusta TaxID=568900 RepID=A0A9N8HUH6_9STRA|nr:expressed unknown protein [Seminavis robusta]|eukprot:Sro1818_g299611.1  (155) ;mRNA; f:20305-20863
MHLLPATVPFIDTIPDCHEERKGRQPRTSTIRRNASTMRTPPRSGKGCSLTLLTTRSNLLKNRADAKLVATTCCRTATCLHGNDNTLSLDLAPQTPSLSVHNDNIFFFNLNLDKLDLIDQIEKGLPQAFALCHKTFEGSPKLTRPGSKQKSYRK